MSKTVAATPAGGLAGGLLVAARDGCRGGATFCRCCRSFVLGAAAGVFTAWVEQKFIGAEGADFALSLVERCLIAGRAIWFYLGKLFWPADLIFIYPRWQVSHGVWWQYLFPAAALLLLGRRCGRCGAAARGPLAACCSSSERSFPSSGFLNVFPFVYSFVADHFQYLASLGVIALAFGRPRLCCWNAGD